MAPTFGHRPGGARSAEPEPSPSLIGSQAARKDVQEAETVHCDRPPAEPSKEAIRSPEDDGAGTSSPALGSFYSVALGTAFGCRALSWGFCLAPGQGREPEPSLSPLSPSNLKEDHAQSESLENCGANQNEAFRPRLRLSRSRGAQCLGQAPERSQGAPQAAEKGNAGYAAEGPQASQRLNPSGLIPRAPVALIPSPRGAATSGEPNFGWTAARSRGDAPRDAWSSRKANRRLEKPALMGSERQVTNPARPSNSFERFAGSPLTEASGLSGGAG